MKHLIAFFLVCLLTFSSIFAHGVSAQAAETIWMETSKDSYSAGETVIVTIKAKSATPFQGFTFKLRYEPACLQPSVPTSKLAGLNYMPVPQKTGLVNAIFANTSPLIANGALAEVKFKILASCQGTLNLDKATLNVSDASGMPAPIQGIFLGTSSLLITTGGSEAVPTQPSSAPKSTQTTRLVITPNSNSNTQPLIDLTPQGSSPTASTGFEWLFIPVLFILIGLIVMGVVVGFIRRRRSLGNSEPEPLTQPANPALIIKRGAGVGRILPLLHFPCRIGSDPANEVCLQDARIAPWHAEILADQHGFTLIDLGSPEGTYLNGKPIKNQQSTLMTGDTLRLGGFLLVFGPQI